MRNHVAVWVGLACGACGANVVVEGDEPLCLDWTSPVVPIEQEESWGCSVFAPAPGAPLDPKELSPLLETTHEYVCVERAEDAECPSADGARELLDRCWYHREGELNPVGGSRTSTWVWSACGADPNANGACCYSVYLVTDTIYSALDAAPSDE